MSYIFPLHILSLIQREILLKSMINDTVGHDALNQSTGKHKHRTISQADKGSKLPVGLVTDTEPINQV